MKERREKSFIFTEFQQSVSVRYIVGGKSGKHFRKWEKYFAPPLHGLFSKFGFHDVVNTWMLQIFVEGCFEVTLPHKSNFARCSFSRETLTKYTSGLLACSRHVRMLYQKKKSSRENLFTYMFTRKNSRDLCWVMFAKSR